MDEASKNAVLSAVRSLLLAVGSILVTRGFLSDGEMQQLVGACMVVLPVIWGMYDKFHAEEKAKAREVVALNTGIALSNRDPNPTPPAAAHEVPALIAQASPAAPPIE